MDFSAMTNFEQWKKKPVAAESKKASEVYGCLE